MKSKKEIKWNEEEEEAEQLLTVVDVGATESLVSEDDKQAKQQEQAELHVFLSDRVIKDRLIRVPG